MSCPAWASVSLSARPMPATWAASRRSFGSGRKQTIWARTVEATIAATHCTPTRPTATPPA
ncbi:MAG: hypothetical protein U1F24_07900 [Alphaproteobacteria bacterium]